ncbi:MAG: DUF3298 and DUF4163 domain-containing protein [Firmicutes bacterium]|nr:DUF3298 and DUF4163 domain-containing protein [Bacillota bacterium]
MKGFEHAKSEYEKIKAPKALKERIEKSMEKKRGKAMLFKISGAAAAIAVTACITLLNLSPSFAYAFERNSVINAIIKVFTFGKYETQENGYQAKVVTPAIEGLLDKDFEKQLNESFKENANAVIAAYENDLKELKALYGDETIHMGVESNYIIKTDTDDILAIDVYLLNIAGSSSTKHTFYTIDKKTGQLLSLNGIFKKGTDYVGILSSYIQGEMLRQNKEEDGLFWVEPQEYITEVFENINADQNFYINSDGNIVICFDKYEVAAGAQGSPEFIIPKSITAPHTIR